MNTEMRLASAQTLLAATLAEGRRRATRPLAVVVLDAGGHVVVSAREDGAGFARIRIAEGKAWGALGLGLGTRTLAARAAAAPTFFGAAASLLDGRLIPVPGGLLLSSAGVVVGAVGVSGDTADLDEACGRAGALAAGFACDV